MTIVLLAVAGGLGAGTRFILDGLLRSRLRTALPIGTMLINITGSLVLGLLTGMVIAHQSGPELVKILGIGFLGGYTTFSTASFETVRLFQTGRVGFALASGLGTLVLSVGAAISGLVLGGGF